MAGGRADLFVVERYRKTIRRFDHARLRVKTFPARAARGAPDRFLRIERRLAGHFIE
jgi:hypothetical protein